MKSFLYLPLLFAVPLLGCAELQVFAFRFPPGFDPLTSENGAFSLVPAGTLDVAVRDGGLGLNGRGSAHAKDGDALTPVNGFDLSFHLRADHLPKDYNAALISHYSFQGVDDRSWFVGEQGGVLFLTLSPDGRQGFQFPSTLRLRKGVVYEALVEVRLHAEEGGSVRWSWRVPGEAWRKQPWQKEPALTRIYNSSAPLRLGALTKNGKADNHWIGWVDEVVMNRVEP